VKYLIKTSDKCPGKTYRCGGHVWSAVPTLIDGDKLGAEALAACKSHAFISVEEHTDAVVPKFAEPVPVEQPKPIVNMIDSESGNTDAGVDLDEDKAEDKYSYGKKPRK